MLIQGICEVYVIPGFYRIRLNNPANGAYFIVLVSMILVQDFMHYIDGKWDL